MFSHEDCWHPCRHTQPEDRQQSAAEKERHIEGPFAAQIAAEISDTRLGSLLVCGNAAHRFTDQEKEAEGQKQARQADKYQSEAPGRHRKGFLQGAGYF